MIGEIKSVISKHTLLQKIDKYGLVTKRPKQ